MQQIEKLFDQLDYWRHFPNYQLERRADIFFSLYLPEVLEDKLGFAVRSELAPEFPLCKGTINGKSDIDQSCKFDFKSCKVDYLAVSASGEKALLVELKTEGKSRRTGQDKYLEDAKDKGLTDLLKGLLQIFGATKAKRKYFCLLLHLERMGLLSIEPQLKNIMVNDRLQGVTEASDLIKIKSEVKEAQIVYVLPREDDEISLYHTVITFREFADIVGRHPDPLSRRFAQSLREWAQVSAGDRHLG